MLVRTTGKMSTKTIYMDFKYGFLAIMSLGVICLEVVIQEEEMIIPGAEVILVVAGFREIIQHQVLVMSLHIEGKIHNSLVL